MTFSTLAQFIPYSNVITGITNEITPTITTQAPHGYNLGGFVRLNIPKGFGMPEVNGRQTVILSIPTTSTFVCDLDTSLLTPFAIPGTAKQVAQVIPIGELTQTLQSSKRNVMGNPIDAPI